MGAEKTYERILTRFYCPGVKKAVEDYTDSAKAFKSSCAFSTESQIPAIIGQTKCHIETEVVAADIPLLLSKTSLKRSGAVLDLQNDKAIMFKHPVTLELTSSGHYCVNLLHRDLSYGTESVVKMKF